MRPSTFQIEVQISRLRRMMCRSSTNGSLKDIITSSHQSKMIYFHSTYLPYISEAAKEEGTVQRYPKSSLSRSLAETWLAVGYLAAIRTE